MISRILKQIKLSKNFCKCTVTRQSNSESFMGIWDIHFFGHFGDFFIIVVMTWDNTSVLRQVFYHDPIPFYYDTILLWVLDNIRANFLGSGSRFFSMGIKLNPSEANMNPWLLQTPKSCYFFEAFSGKFKIDFRNWATLTAHRVLGQSLIWQIEAYLKC